MSSVIHGFPPYNMLIIRISLPISWRAHLGAYWLTHDKHPLEIPFSASCTVVFCPAWCGPKSLSTAQEQGCKKVDVRASFCDTVGSLLVGIPSVPTLDAQEYWGGEFGHPLSYNPDRFSAEAASWPAIWDPNCFRLSSSGMNL